MDERLSQSRIARNSLKFHWRTQVAVALGVAAATAVLVGALLVGDSVRGSLRHLVLDRLGRIDQVLVVDRFFRQSLADELAEEPQFKQSFTSAVPAVLFPAATVEQQTASGKRLASGVLVVGSGAAFWQLDRPANRPKHVPGDGEIVINRPLADELGAKVGDTLVVRFGKGDQVPADSPLGRRTGRIATLAELTLVEIIPAAGLGQFSLQQSQMAPRNAYVSLTAVQGALDQANMANTVFIGGRDFDQPALAAAAKELPKLLSPHLTDYGLSLEHVEMTYGRGDQARPIYDYYSLFSERMLIEPAMERVVRQALEGLHAQPLLTYLANDIRRVQGSGDSEIRSAGGGIPYSTITAMDPAPGGPLVDADGKPLAPLSDDEIVLTSWAAEDQHAAIGDTIRVSYFEPETTHGQAVERSVDLRVQAIVPLTEPKSGYSRRGPAIYDEPPTPANDPHLTPEVKGITDQASIADWDPPFPFDQKRIRPQDDEYWENHRTTPKAYVSLKTGQRLWGSRFGNVTSFRIPAAAGVTTESMEEKVLAAAKPSEERLGFAFLPLKRQGLAAASGTTPFDVLFLLLSMFIIAAAIMLVWLLFRLGVEQRADEIGLLLALGWTRSRVRRLFVLEGAVVAAAGAVLGVGFGLAYAWLMIAGLRTWWVGAIATPFLQLHATPLSLVAGFFLGWAASIATIWVSLRRAKKAVVRQLLAGQFVTATAVEPGSPAIRRGRRTMWIAAVLFIAAVGTAFYAATLGGEAQAGAFLGAGAMLLVSLLMLTHRALKAPVSRDQTGSRNVRATSGSRLAPGYWLGQLALRNAGRNTSRSTATIALVASAAFLIVAVSAFRMSPSSAGVGGFDLLAESSQPIYADLNSPAGRRDVLADRANVLDDTTVLALRLKAGDDASCRNLYQPTQPRILGVTPQMIGYFDNRALPARFAWSATSGTTPEEKANPWRVLTSPAAAEEPVSVVLDQNTAMYSLRLYGGVGQTFGVTYSDGTNVKFRVAGLLANSVLQGSLLIGEADFKRLFPQISGYRYFLIHTPPGKETAVANALEDRLSDEGFDAIDARARLADLLAVQNTYISTFQTLGALGLVLGTFGLAAVQLRSVFERRKELALMRAAGFRRRRLGEMMLLENLVLLIGGLGIGALAALVVVLPQMLLGGAHVPLADLLAMLGVVLIVGVITGLLAVRATLEAPLVAALRGE